MKVLLHSLIIHFSCLNQLLLSGAVSGFPEEEKWFEKVFVDQDGEESPFTGVPLNDFRVLMNDFPSISEDDPFVEEFDEEEDFLNDPESSANVLREKASLMSTNSKDSFYEGDVSNEGNNLYDAIIVGAGWSGVAAAMRLQAEGITNFKVLEGRNYVGGRSYTKQFNGENLDMGSMWLLYGSCNPIYNHTVSVGTSMRPYKDRMLLYMPTGVPMPYWTLKYYVKYLYWRVWYYYVKSKQYMIDSDETYTGSVREILSMIENYSNYEEKRLFLLTFLQMKLTIPYGADFEDLGLWYGEHGSYLCLRDEDQFVQSGFSNIVQTFAQPIEDRIQTEAVVKVINHKNNNVKVVYEDRSTGDEPYESKTIYAKKVIVTVPIGVLQEEKIKIRPKLSNHIKAGINGLGMGWQIRIFMFWDEEDVFWPQSPDVFMDSTTALETDVKIKYYIPSFLYETPKTFMFAVLRSDEAKEIERLYARTDEAKYVEEITKIAMAPLRGLFGDDIPDPKLATANQWTYDEFSYGAYSYNKLGHKRSFRKRLKAPIDDKLFFAGEGTSDRFWGTVHGAYITGNLAAYKVVESLNTTSFEV